MRFHFLPKIEFCLITCSEERRIRLSNLWTLLMSSHVCSSVLVVQAPFVTSGYSRLNAFAASALDLLLLLVLDLRKTWKRCEKRQFISVRVYETAKHRHMVIVWPTCIYIINLDQESRGFLSILSSVERACVVFCSFLLKKDPFEKWKHPPFLMSEANWVQHCKNVTHLAQFSQWYSSCLLLVSLKEPSSISTEWSCHSAKTFGLLSCYKDSFSKFWMCQKI